MYVTQEEINEVVAKNIQRFPDQVGMWRNPIGHFVPDAMVTDAETLREELVIDLCDEALVLNLKLKKFKERGFSEIAAFVEINAERFDMKVGGEKGGVTLRSFNGQWKVERSIQAFLALDNNINIAKALIDECLMEWTDRDEMKTVIEHIFNVGSEGKLRTDLVLSLLRWDIKDAKWVRAMDALRQSINVACSRAYLRIYRRVGDTNKWQAITLDIASV